MKLMGNIFNVLIFILLFIWQLPQNFIALCLFACLGKKKKIKYKDYCLAYECEKMAGGISLGSFILLDDYLSKDELTILHEYGHSWYSKVLGPLYLLIIGLPSLFNATFNLTDCYYDFYTERWANKKANLGVDRACRLYLLK